MTGFKQAFNVVPCFRPKGEKKLGEAMFDTVLHIKMTLYDMILFLCFLISATFVLLQHKSPYAFHFNDSMVNTFVSKRYAFNIDKELIFKKLKSETEFFEYMETIFFKSIHRNNSAYDFSLKDTQNDNLLSNVILGPIRLRQIRVHNSSCEIITTFGLLFHECFGKYTEGNELKRGTWQEVEWVKNKTLPIRGQLTTYKGPGYGISFVADYETDVLLLRRLRDKNWIDSGTRLVVIEFTVFAASMDLICPVRLLIEFAPVGALITSYEIRTYLLYRGFFELDSELQIGFLICLLFLINFTVEEIIGLYDGKLNYFAKKWNYVDLAIVSFSWTIFWLLVQRKEEFDKMYKIVQLPEFIEKEIFLDMSSLSKHEDLYRAILGLAVFLLWIKIFKFVGINQQMQTFSATMHRCGMELASFGLMFLLIFVAFAIFCYLLFGGEIYSFRSFKEAFITMIKMSVGTFHYVDLENNFPTIGPIFYLIYLIVVPYILLNMFLAIIDDTYSKVKAKQVKINPVYLGLYLKNFLRSKSAKIDIDSLAIMKHKPQTDYQKYKEKLLPQYFQVMDSDEGTVEQELEALDLRITRNEELYSKISVGLDKLVLKLSQLRRTT